MAKKAKAAAAAAEYTYDEAASQRVLAGCGSIASLASTAVEQATDSATPFLSFAQRSRIRALSVNFEGGPVQVQHAPAQRPTASVVTSGEGGLSRDEIDAIVTHRVEIALTEALQRIGVAPDSTIQTQVDGRIGAQITEQENRILDYVRGQLTDSLRVFEDRLEERLGNIETKQQSAEVDEQLEQAREDLLKNIDEVRTVDVGMDQYAFAAGIVEVDGTGASETVDEGEIELGGEDEAVELGGEDEAVELGGEDEEIELGDGESQLEVEAVSAETEVIEAGDEDVEVEAGEVEAGEVEVEADEVEVEAEAEPIDEEQLQEIAADELEPEEIAADELEPEEGELASVDVEDYVEVEAGELEADEDEADEVIIEDDEAAAEATEDEVVIEDEAAEQEEEEFDLGLDFSDNAEEGEVELAVGDDAIEELEDESVELQPADDGEELEEISLIQQVPDGAGDDAAESIDLDESAITELEDNDVGTMTLGEGPDEIVVPDDDEDSDEDSEIEVEIDVEEDLEDEAEDSGDGRSAIITKYMDRALQMGARQQFTPALELYSKVLDLDTGHFDALVSRGVIYSKTKDYRKATEDFRRAQEIAPERAGSYYGLAELHYNRRQFNKAIKNYNLALERDDQLAEAYCRRGLSYYYLKNYKVAFHDLYKAYDINPDLPKIRSFLKLVQNKIKESEG